MARAPTFLATRKVKWQELTSAHDNKTLFHKEHVGYIIDHHWTSEGRCFFLLSDKDGRLVTRDASLCLFHDSPLQAAIKQQIT